MRDPQLVREIEPGRDLPQDRQQFFQRPPAALAGRHCPARGAVAITVSPTNRVAGDEILLRVSNIANPITLAASGVTIKYAAGVSTITTVEDLITLWWRTTTQVVATIVRAS